MGHQWFVLIALLLAAAKAKAIVQAYPATVSFTEKYGDTDENFDVTFEYCDDYTNDGKLDVKVTVAIQRQSTVEFGTEDVIGAAFDINGDFPDGLLVPPERITLLESTPASNPGNAFTPRSLVDENGVRGNDLSLSIQGGGIQDSFDVGVAASGQGAGNGVVKSFSFIITLPGTDLDGPALLSNTNWHFRTQSTNGGGGSAKTGGNAGTLPACPGAAVPTCGDIDGAGPGDSAYRCTGIFIPKPDSANIPIQGQPGENNLMCCVEGPTCADINGADPGDSAYDCPGTLIPKDDLNSISIQGVAAANLEDECCDQGPTCADVAAPLCPTNFIPKDDLNSISTHNLQGDALTDACCDEDPPAGSPTLLVTKSGPATAKVGEIITYLVTAGVADGSPDAAVLELEEVLNSTVAKFVEPLPESENCELQSAQRVTCSWTNVAAGAPKVLQFKVEGTATGSFKNTASVSAEGATTKTASATTTLNPEEDPEETPQIPGPTITLVKTGPSAVVNAGEEFEFKLTAGVVNLVVPTAGVSPATMTSIILTDPMPAGLTLVRSTPASCFVNSMLASCTLEGPFPQTITLTAVGQVKGEFTNTAELTAGGESVSAGASVTVFVATCGEVTFGGGSFNSCPAGFQYNPSFADRTQVNAGRCCAILEQAPQGPTCADTNGAGTGTPSFGCPDGWAPKPSGGSISIQFLSGDARRDACCNQVPTCADIDGAGAGTAAYPCPVNWAPKASWGSIIIGSLSEAAQVIACCDQLAIPEPTDVIVAKTVVSSSTAVLGIGDPPTFSFVVRLTAAAGTIIRNPVLLDTMSDGLVFQGQIGASHGGECTRRSDRAFSCSWTGVTIGPGDEFEVSYTAVATKAGTFTNTAECRPAGDLDSTNNEAVVTVTVTAPPPGPPVLDVTKAGPTTAKVGDPITYVVTAGVAAGSPPAAVLVLEEVLDSNVAEFVRPLPEPDNCKLQNPQKVNCTWSNVQPADVKVLRFTVTATAAGAFTNTARVSTIGATPKESEVRTTLQPETAPPIPTPTIALVKTGPRQVVNAGEEFAFVLTARLTSGSAASMILTDPMPAGSGLRLIKSTPQSPCVITDALARCTLSGPFPRSIVLTAVGEVPGKFTNTAVLTAGGVSASAEANVTVFVETCGEVTPGGVPFSRCPRGFEYNPSFAGRTPANRVTCCAIAAQSAPDLSITKAVDAAAVRVGEDVVFTIQVKHNAGLQDTLAQNVVVTDTLPVGLRPYADSFSVTPSVGEDACTFNANNPRVFSCALGSIPAGETRTITIRCLADGSRLGALRNVARVGCNKAGQAAADPTCNKRSNPAIVRVTRPPPSSTPCVAALTVDLSPAPKRAAKGSLIVWDLTLTPIRGAATSVDVANPVPITLSDPTLIRTPSGGNCSFSQANGQSTLQCSFAKIDKPVVVRYRTRANVAAAISSAVEVKYKPCTSVESVVTTRNNNNVVIWTPIIGSCCDKDFGCTAGVARGLCTSRGGTWSKDMTACFTGQFCTGACCSGGGSLTAQCLTTTKAACTGNWDPTTSCFNQYCPRPCLDKCQECRKRNDTCCPGFTCQNSGRYGKTYCLPNYVPYKPLCSGAGGVCGLAAGGNKCCKGLDCIVGAEGNGVCTPREICKPRGSVCGGLGECGSSLFCAPNGKCQPARCRSQGKKFQKSAAGQRQKNSYHHECQAFFNAASSGAL